MSRRDLTAVQWGAVLAWIIGGVVIVVNAPDDWRWITAGAMVGSWLLALVWAAADVAKAYSPSRALRMEGRAVARALRQGYDRRP